MKTAILKTIAVQELKPAEYNPRKKLKPGDKEYQKIKDSITEFGFADDMKVYKANPEAYKGHYGDVASMLRVAITGKANTPDLYQICTLLGKEEVVSRLKLASKILEK